MQAEALDASLSAIETLERASPDASLQDIKALLGRMLFSGRSAHKKVRGHPTVHSTRFSANV